MPILLCDISHMNSWMLFIFAIVTICHKRLMLVKSKFTPCQNRVNWRNLAWTMMENCVIYAWFWADMMVWFWPRHEVQINQHVCLEPGINKICFSWSRKVLNYHSIPQPYILVSFCQFFWLSLCQWTGYHRWWNQTSSI